MLWVDGEDCSEKPTSCSKPGLYRAVPAAPEGPALQGRGGTAARGRQGRPRAAQAQSLQIRRGRRPGGNGGRLIASFRAPPAGSRTPGAWALTPPALLPSPLHAAPCAPGPPSEAAVPAPARPSRAPVPAPARPSRAREAAAAPSMVRCGGVVLRKYGNFIDNLRVYVRGGTGGMGYPRLGGEGGRGGDVWFVAQERTTLKSIKHRYPQKRFIAGTGANSR
uniref:Obg domain-containing protein n=1 Tax=Calidris pygmaea TaxID=425635 RepID=A0A8C3KIG3_9CHAR